MKKLLLSLFAIATIFVACDKEENLVEPMANELEEIQVSQPTDFSDMIDSSFDFIGDIDVPKGESSSSKVGASGTQWIHAIFFDHGSQNVVLLRGSGAEEACWGNLPTFASSTLYTWDTATDMLTVVVENASGESAPRSRPQSAGSAARYDRLFGSTTLNRIRVTNSRRSAAITGTPPAISLFDFSCSPDLTGAYDITPAPFPLTGFLATINSSFDFLGAGLDADAANYAGTSTSTVIEAIERDIMN